MKKRWRLIAGFTAIIFGIGLFLWPDFCTWNLNRKTQVLVAEFEKKKLENIPEESLEEETGEVCAAERTQGTCEEILQKIQNYNTKIWQDGQADFRDAWSVTQAPEDLPELADQMFGYITIPAMEVTLAVYLGASEEHMAAGAAVLGGTSVPVGGTDTNCVIAGHRGYRGAPYFRNIEKIGKGDLVYLTNSWETLCYEVTGIEIIDPTDIDAVKIQAGKDMLTLMTCHPYRSHGKYRYVVFCERCQALSTEEDNQVQEESAEPLKKIKFRNMLSDWAEEESEAQNSIGEENSSEQDIRSEELIRRGAAILILLMVAVSTWKSKKR